GRLVQPIGHRYALPSKQGEPIVSVTKPIPSLPFPASHLVQHRIEWHGAIGGMLGIAIAGGIGVILWGATTVAGSLAVAWLV
ncbi:hypothetical protein GGR39_003338, partial [Novosphingobium fluoreni]